MPNRTDKANIFDIATEVQELEILREKLAPQVKKAIHLYSQEKDHNRIRDLLVQDDWSLTKTHSQAKRIEHPEKAYRRAAAALTALQKEQTIYTLEIAKIFKNRLKNLMGS